MRLVATAAGYRSLLDLLVRRSLKFRLPPGSIAYRLSSIAELAARAPAVSGDDLLTGLLSERLGLPAAACPRVACRRHGTPLLEAAAPGGAFALRHWLRLLGSDRADATILDLASLAAPAHRRAPPSARLDGSGRLTFAAASS